MRVGAVAVMVLATVMSAAAQPGDVAEPRKLLLSWATSEFMAVEGSRLRLQHRYRLDGASLWLEAEHPSSMRLEANRTVGSDRDAVGARCVDFVDRLDFVIDVAAPGLYQSWTRCFFPFAASWNHTEGMARDDMRVVDDLRPGDTELAGRWVWRKGPQYQLAEGTVNYVFDGYHGGARLDRILLTSDLEFVPEGPGAPPSVNIAAHTTGRAETRDLRLGPVAQWLRLEGLPATHVEAQVSLDDGQSWLTVPPDGSLAELPASPTDPVRLRVRVQLTRDDALDPIVDAVRLVYVPGEQEVWTIANRHLRANFDPLTGSLLSLENLAGEAPVPCVLMGEQLPLLNLYVQQPDRLDTLVPVSSLDGEISGRVSADGRRLEMEFALLEGGLRAFVSCEANDTPLMRWRLRVRNITSRHCQDYLVTREGGLIAHTVLYPHNTFVRECQFIQEQPGVALLRVVLAPGADPAELVSLQRKIEDRADGLMSVRLEAVTEIPLTPRGKRVLVDQRLDLGPYGHVDG